jgi:hypothetical protein
MKKDRQLKGDVQMYEDKCIKLDKFYQKMIDEPN